MSKNRPVGGGYKGNLTKILSGILVFGFTAIFSAVFFGSIDYIGTASAESSTSSLEVSIAPNVAISIIDNNGIENLVSLNITPSANGVFSSASTNITASTTNGTGYTITMSDVDNDTNLVHEDTTITTNNTIPTLTSQTDESSFPTNYYGYNFNNTTITGTTDLAYLPIPSLSTPTTLITTDSQGNATYPFTIATKVDTSLPAGTYKDTITFSITANYVSPQVYEFDYTGAEQTFTVPHNGTYRLEVWGAQGGSADSAYPGGYGAYSVGEINLIKNDELHVNVGGSGLKGNKLVVTAGGYNGGGSAKGSDAAGNPGYIGSGGGATHIATSSGLLRTLNINDVIIIASGGGGSAYYSANGMPYAYANGGNGGGIVGATRTNLMTNATTNLYVAQGGTQTGSIASTTSYCISGSFGQGANGSSASSTNYAGGGSGLYGGNTCITTAAAGGSGYIGNTNLTNKHMTCYDCTTSDVEATKTISNTCVASTPTADCAKQGNGYVRITGPL